MAVAAKAPNTADASRKSTAVLVDAAAAFADALAKLLGSKGYDVRTARDVSGAITACGECAPALAFVDAEARTGDGVSAVADLRRRYPDLLCVVVTAQVDAECVLAALRDGAYDCLRLPIDRDELAGMLARAESRLRLVQIKRKADRAVRESEERYRTLVALSPVGFYRTDLAGNCFYVNEGWQKLTGHGPSEALGRGWLNAVHPEDRERVLAEWGRFCREGRPFRLEYRYLTPDGETRWVLGQTAFEHGPNGQSVGIVGTVTDITDRRRAEEAERRIQRIEALVRMSGGIAHEFNNLLAVLVGNLELMQDDETLSDATRRLVERAIGAADRGAELVAQLQSFSRREPQSPEPVDAPAVIEGTVQLVKPLLEPSISLLMEPGNDIWPVYTDAAYLEAALINLINNARDAMPEGGVIRVRARNLEVDRRKTGAPVELTPGSYVVIDVTDSGTGMTLDVMARAFDPFFSTKEVGRGTGLGLSMVYGFATEGGGTARIKSAPGKGTTVSLYLRRSWQIAPTYEVARAEHVEPGRGERILVVEDDSALRRLAVELLTSLGYQASQAGTVLEARAQMAREPGFDLLLINRHLARRPGAFDPLRETPPGRPRLALLYMSGQSPREAASGAPGEDAGPVLKKPFRRAELARQVRRLLDARARDHQPE